MSLTDPQKGCRLYPSLHIFVDRHSGYEILEPNSLLTRQRGRHYTEDDSMPVTRVQYVYLLYLSSSFCWMSVPSSAVLQRRCQHGMYSVPAEGNSNVRGSLSWNMKWVKV